VTQSFESLGVVATVGLGGEIYRFFVDVDVFSFTIIYIHHQW